MRFIIENLEDVSGRTIIYTNLNFDNQTIKFLCKNYFAEYILRLSSMHVKCTVCDESFKLNLTARLSSIYMYVSFKTNASENKVEGV